MSNGHYILLEEILKGHEAGLSNTASLENTGNVACVEASMSLKTYKDRELEIVSTISSSHNGDLDRLRRRLGK